MRFFMSKAIPVSTRTGLWNVLAIQIHNPTDLPAWAGNEPRGEFELVHEGLTHADALELLARHDAIGTQCVLMLWPAELELPNAIGASLEMHADWGIPARL
jgi:hypothetical protein